MNFCSFFPTVIEQFIQTTIHQYALGKTASGNYNSRSSNYNSMQISKSCGGMHTTVPNLAVPLPGFGGHLQLCKFCRHALFPSVMFAALVIHRYDKAGRTIIPTQPWRHCLSVRRVCKSTIALPGLIKSGYLPESWSLIDLEPCNFLLERCSCSAGSRPRGLPSEWDQRPKNRAGCLWLGYCDSYRNCDGSEAPWTELETSRKARGKGKQHDLIFMTLLDQCSFDDLVIVNFSYLIQWNVVLIIFN